MQDRLTETRFVRSGLRVGHGRDLADIGARDESARLRLATDNDESLYARVFVDFGKHAIEIFDVRGRLVRTVLDAKVPAGVGRVDWDGRDDDGRYVAGGTYYVRLRGDDLNDVRKIALVK